MTRHEIFAGRQKRRVIVERPRRPKRVLGWTRLQVHQIGLAAVADELGLASMLDMGGIVTAERSRALLGRKGPISSGRISPEKASADADLTPISMPEKGGGCTPSDGVEKRDIGCAAPKATGPEIRPDLSTAGLLAADVSRLIRPDRQRQFGAELWLGVTL